MSGSGQPAEGPDWVRLRHDYEAGIRPVTEIAGEAGTNAQNLATHAARNGWKLRTVRRARTEATRETIRRLKTVLQQRLGEIEAQIAALGAEATAATSERDIRAMNTLVRTLEKVLELERKDRSHRARRRKEYRRFDDAEREALAHKLDALRKEYANAAPAEAPEQTGDPRT